MPAAKKTTSRKRVTKTGDGVIPDEKVTEIIDNVSAFKDGDDNQIVEQTITQ